MTHTAPSESPTSSSTSATTALTVLRGDGIGPEVVDAAMRVMQEAGAKLDIDPCRAGEQIFREGLQTGVPQATIDSIQRTGLVLKGPLQTPIGFGEKSANVTLRKLFETYANVRPSRELPGVVTPFSGRGIDLVVVRENIEDLYAGIEHMQSPGVAQSLKVITKFGSEKIARLAFEFARSEGRKLVTVATKANIMKLSEGLFQHTFDTVAAEYPDIEAQHMLVDNCAHQLVMHPERFDVICTTNMNGDILSDLTSGLVGGLGFSSSANIGADTAMFEAVHGSAPDIAGKDIANPTAIMLSSVMLLKHAGQNEAAAAMEDAILVTLEDGKTLTGDIAREHPAVGTTAFTDAVVSNLGRQPKVGTRRVTKALKMPPASWRPEPVVVTKREVVGLDVFIEQAALGVQEFGQAIEGCATACDLQLRMVDSRGTKVFPGDVEDTDTVDMWRARFMRNDETQDLDDAKVLELLGCIASKFRWVHVEKLQVFDGELGFTKAQGED